MGFEQLNNSKKNNLIILENYNLIICIRKFVFLIN